MIDPQRREKKRIRGEMAARLASVDDAHAASAAAALVEHVRDWAPFVRAESLMAFLSLETEIDTSPLLKLALSMGKIVGVPRVVPGPRRQMDVVQLGSLADAVSRSGIGVREPSAGRLLDPSSLSLVFAPSVAFTPRGDRLGHGGGYYDRFLSGPAAGAVRCGLSYELQVIEHVPTDAHDVPMQWLLSERGIRRVSACNSGESS